MRNILRIVRWILCFVSVAQAIPGQFIEDGYKMRHDYAQSIRYPYTLADNTTLPFYDAFGQARVTPEGIRLNGPLPEQTGAIWAQKPNNLKEWAVVMSVSIRGDADVKNTQGMALWYSKDRATSGPVFGSQDEWIGFGIFFDTFGHNQQSKNPAVLAVYNDGKTKYYTGQAFAHCYKKYRTPSSQTNQMLVKMVYNNRTLTVDIDSRGFGYDYTRCFEYSPIYMTTGYYFGVSAGAGQVPDTHDLVSLDVYELNPSGLKAEKASKKNLSPEEEKMIKKHEELQKKLKDLKKKDKDASKSLDLKDVLAALSRLEENQMALMDRVDQLLDAPGTGSTNFVPGHGTEKVVDRIGQVEGQVQRMSDMLMRLVRTTEDLAGSHRGTQDAVTQIASLNQATNSKLDGMRDPDGTSDNFRQIIEDKESRFYYYVLGFIFVQILFFIAFNTWRKYQSEKSYDKKFL